MTPIIPILRFSPQVNKILYYGTYTMAFASSDEKFRRLVDIALILRLKI